MLRTTSRAVTALCLLAAAVLCACASRGVTAGAGAAKTSAPEGAEEPLLAPPDGEWLIDEQGRQYFIEEVPKYEGNYFWLIPDKSVQLRYGAIYDVVSHDADSFAVKIYRVPAPPPAPQRAAGAPAKPPKAAPEPQSRSAAKPVDRLAFARFDNGLPAEGQWRNGFELADMNGDGHLDIVHGPARKGRQRPVIFLGDGKGGWRAWSEVRYPAMAYDYGDVAVADFNRDGRLDIALAMHLRGVVVLVANAAAGFEPWTQGLPLAAPGRAAGAPAGFSSRAIAAVDWDGDGWVDLAALGEGPQLAIGGSGERSQPMGSFGLVVFFNRGDGTWAARDEASEPRVGGHFGDGLAVGDLDGNGKPDAALSSSVIGEKMILRLGDGTGWSASHIAGLRGSVLVNAVEILDSKRDGRTDLVLGYQSHEEGAWRSGIDAFHRQDDGEWQRRELWSEEGRRGVFALATGDLDADGHPDLAALTGDGRTLVFLGDGAGHFAPESSPEIVAAPERCKGFAVALGDLDGDGRADLVGAFAGESSALFDADRCTYGGAIRAWRSTERRR